MKIKENYVIRRLKSNTPPFFKKVRKVMLSIATAIGVALGALYALPINVDSVIPIWVIKYCGMTVFLMTMFGAFIAELTTDNKDVQDEQYKSEE